MGRNISFLHRYRCLYIVANMIPILVCTSVISRNMGYWMNEQCGWCDMENDSECLHEYVMVDMDEWLIQMSEFVSQYWYWCYHNEY